VIGRFCETDLASSYVREAIRAAKPLGIGETPKVVPLAGAR